MEVSSHSGAVSSSPVCDIGTALLPVLSAKHPPCRVCTGRGSGIHYGVNTCEACKCFFGRYLKTGRAKMKCRAYGRCDVTTAGKRPCTACRLKRCLELGMCVEGIRIGRSAYIQVTAAIEEVKKLESELRIRQDGTLMTPGERQQQMEWLIHKLTDTHLHSAPHSDTYYRSVLQSEQSFVEQRQLEHHWFGERRALSRTEHREIYETTRLDADGRLLGVDAIFPVLQDMFTSHTRFTNVIPAFRSLSKNDQKKLLQAGLFESYGFLHLEMFNASEGTFVMPWNVSIVGRMHDMLAYSDHPTDVYDRMYALVDKLQSLDLTTEERVLAAALCILLSDADLSAVGQKIVSRGADYLSEVLLHLIRDNHEPEERIYTRLIDIIVNQKQIMLEHRELSINFAQDLRSYGFCSPVINALVLGT